VVVRSVWTSRNRLIAACLSASVNVLNRAAPTEQEYPTQQGIGVESSKVLNDIPGVTVPMKHPAVGLYSIHECTPSILQRKS
jgi:hypothetical protein